jgi:hypothetical protein
MKTLYKAVYWVGLGIVLTFGLVVLLYRAAALLGITVWVIFFSSLPWWERILAPAAIVAGLVFLSRRYTGTLGHRIPRNRNFVYYTTETREVRSVISSKTDDL